MTIGAKLSHARILIAHLSLDDLAEKTELSKSLLINIELHRVTPNVDVLSKLASALGVEVSYFEEAKRETTEQSFGG